MVSRVYVEKKPGFDIGAQSLTEELRDVLGISSLKRIRIINRYDVEGIDGALFSQSIDTVFSVPQTDITYSSLDQIHADTMFAVEYLPGQFDQRAESASECIQLISLHERPALRSARLYAIDGNLSDEDLATVKDYLINPVEAREADLAMPETLAQEFPVPADVEVLEGFNELDAPALAAFIEQRGLAMDLADIEYLQQYFRDEGRPPTIAEVKMLDTYWSDHCRHTTFGTRLDSIDISDAAVQASFYRYLAARAEIGHDRPITLMDIATFGARYLKAKGRLEGLDESDEINACTVKVAVDVDGQMQDWLYLFKNETHNHPTEIEPFGGAATCVGGAIRDPLSGRAYVYHAMRITGAADPTCPVSQTMEGKLPQRKLVITAAEGFSSYGNQIGLATGCVHEFYHPGYAAKRMEIGAVVAATPASHVRRQQPKSGDVVVLLGGRTGRDGIGGATGSSKAHSLHSLETCGAEVQKGNAPTERKLQRLFRRGDVASRIKRCNDFGAGGVSVAIGELAEGLEIDLDAVPKKYEGLDGTEIAISESQERMAVVLDAADLDAFIAAANEENLEATQVARVTGDARVRMWWRGKAIVDVSREFLGSAGAPKSASAKIGAPCRENEGREGGNVKMAQDATFGMRLSSLVRDLNVASNKGLAERFDSTIGAGSVLMPFGGARQLTPAQAMVAKFPVPGGKTTTVSGMAFGFNPYLSSENPHAGAYLAVVESVCKLVATGFSRKRTYLTLQEYFEKLHDDPVRWGKPASALLGALSAQLDLEVAAIGGKDSMSGSFENLDVPPTLVSFATAAGNIENVVSPEFKAAESPVAIVSPATRGSAASLRHTLDAVEALISQGAAASVFACGYYGIAEAVFKMCVGNRIGFSLEDDSVDVDTLFAPAYGSFIVELQRFGSRTGADNRNDDAADDPGLPKAVASECGIAPDVTVRRLGNTTADFEFDTFGEIVDLGPVQEAWESALEDVFPYRSNKDYQAVAGNAMPVDYRRGCGSVHVGEKFAKPRVIIPVFPGTNCEYDSEAAFERAGAVPTTQVINNLSSARVRESASQLARNIRNSQILMIPGGFSGGDEPDGSAKFIAAFMRSPEVAEAIEDLLDRRDGLILGICNGFQALVKLGLLPHGHITPPSADAATLTFNTIGRHQSRLVYTRVASNMSPWFSKCSVGDIYCLPISHGEGRFVATDALLRQLEGSGQIATQYTDDTGLLAPGLGVNPNGSYMNIEGITSPDGRVLGKMGHSERAGRGLYQNVPGNHYQPIFEGGVAYFA